MPESSATTTSLSKSKEKKQKKNPGTDHEEVVKKKKKNHQKKRRKEDIPKAPGADHEEVVKKKSSLSKRKEKKKKKKNPGADYEEVVEKKNRQKKKRKGDIPKAPAADHEEVVHFVGGVERPQRRTLFFLDVKHGEIIKKVNLPLHASRTATPVVCLNCIYLLGGDKMNLFDMPFYSDEKDSYITKHVFCFDFDNLVKGWADAASMFYGRFYPSVIAFKGKIYVFNGNPTNFAEVFDTFQGSWALLNPPFDSFWATPHVLLDSSRSQILVHCSVDNSLYAYNVANEIWECLIENYGEWSTDSVVVDGVIYTLDDFDESYYNLSAKDCSLRAYSVDEKKELDVCSLLRGNDLLVLKWSAHLYHLGNHNFCLAGYDAGERRIEYIKFSVCKCEDSQTVIIGGPAAGLIQSIKFKDFFRAFV